jgi:hypothetical protein
MFSFFKKPTSQTQEQENFAHHTKLKLKWDGERGKFKKCSLQKVYISDAENIYFVYQDIADLPMERYYQLQRISNELEFTLSNEYLAKWKPTIKEAIAKGDIANIKALFENFEIRTNQFAPDILWLHYAMIFIVRHDENPYGYLEQAQAAKFKDCKEDHDLRSFFLHTAYDLLIVQSAFQTKMQDLQITSEAAFMHYFLKVEMDSLLKSLWS